MKDKKPSQTLILMDSGRTSGILLEIADAGQFREDLRGNETLAGKRGEALLCEIYNHVSPGVIAGVRRVPDVSVVIARAALENAVDHAWTRVTTPPSGSRKPGP